MEKDMLKQIKPLSMHLQYFAEGDPNPNDPPADPQKDDPKNGPGGDPRKETFTQSEVDSQISKAVENALKKQQEKLEKQKQDEIEKAKQDAVEYAKLTQKEKEEADYKKRVESLEKRERELNNRQLLSEIESDLKESELPTAFAESLLTIQDNEKIKESIADIKKQFDEAVNAKVKEALRQDTPAAGGSSRNKTNTMADLRNKQDQQKNKAPDLWA
ncbi:capsid assembly scaffolding protein Gp46 family protein [Virgibacillus salexigens]|uniref:capsid assembly scaffolding protein Gp46 family protein n=1 Tax=Virgibacillus salexigens TaxID=61016 RepID=UPI00308169F8